MRYNTKDTAGPGELALVALFCFIVLPREGSCWLRPLRCRSFRHSTNRMKSKAIMLLICRRPLPLPLLCRGSKTSTFSCFSLATDRELLFFAALLKRASHSTQHPHTTTARQRRMLRRQGAVLGAAVVVVALLACLVDGFVVSCPQRGDKMTGKRQRSASFVPITPTHFDLVLPPPPSQPHRPAGHVVRAVFITHHPW